MSKFKVGDKVVRIKSLEQAWDKLYKPNTPYTVQSLWRSNADGCLHPRVLGEDGQLAGWYSEVFELWTEDDELPPAPDSVRYTTLQYDWQDKYNDQHLTASPDSFTDGVCIHIQGSTTSQRNKDMALSVILSPDEILQLCHDLRRMAMSIKKKEKQA